MPTQITCPIHLPCYLGRAQLGYDPNGLGGVGREKLRASPKAAVCKAGGQIGSIPLELMREAFTSKKDQVQKQGPLPNKDLGSQWRERESAGAVELKCTFCAVSLQALLGGHVPLNSPFSPLLHSSLSPVDLVWNSENLRAHPSGMLRGSI